VQSHDSAWTISSLVTGLGGAMVAQITQSTPATVGAIVVALIPMITVWVRAHYAVIERRLETDRLKAELDVYKALLHSRGDIPWIAVPEKTTAGHE